MIDFVNSTHSTSPSVISRVRGWSAGCRAAIEQMLARPNVRRCIVACCATAFTFATPLIALAVEESEKGDARLEGYSDAQKVWLDKASGATGTWLLFLFMVVIGCSVLFKNARRSHLD